MSSIPSDARLQSASLKLSNQQPLWKSVLLGAMEPKIL